MASGRSSVLSGVALLVTACVTLASAHAFAQTSLTAPQWRPGYEWEYRWTGPGGEGTFVRTVEREAVEDGIPVWVLTNGPDRQLLLRKEDLGYYEEKRAGVAEVRFVPPFLNWVWPLEPGKTWTQTYTREHLRDRATVKVTASCQAQSDRLTVPAGTFERFYCDFAENPLGEAIHPKYGRITVPQGPGLGVDPDPGSSRSYGSADGSAADLVSTLVFGAVERLVGRLDHAVRRDEPLATLRHADTDRQ